MRATTTAKFIISDNDDSLTTVDAINVDDFQGVQSIMITDISTPKCININVTEIRDHIDLLRNSGLNSSGIAADIESALDDVLQDPLNGLMYDNLTDALGEESTTDRVIGTFMEFAENGLNTGMELAENALNIGLTQNGLFKLKYIEDEAGCSISNRITLATLTCAVRDNNDQITGIRGYIDVHEQNEEENFSPFSNR